VTDEIVKEVAEHSLTTKVGLTIPELECLKERLAGYDLPAIIRQRQEQKHEQD
jgi:hypothetical protein